MSTASTTRAPSAVDLVDERELIWRARAGAIDAQGELYRRHWRAVWRRAYAMTGHRDWADDITQDAFERAFRYLDGFAPDAPIRPWLQRIAINRAVDVMRIESLCAPLEQVSEEGACDAEPRDDRQLRAAISELAPERRAVVLLRYWADLDGREMSLRLGVPVGTVHSRLSRALEDLRCILDDDQP